MFLYDEPKTVLDPPDEEHMLPSSPFPRHNRLLPIAFMAVGVLALGIIITVVILALGSKPKPDEPHFSGLRYPGEDAEMHALFPQTYIKCQDRNETIRLAFYPKPSQGYETASVTFRCPRGWTIVREIRR